RIVMETLRDIALSGETETMARLSGVLLISPDIDVDMFREQARTIGPLPQPFVIFTSQKDKAGTFATVWQDVLRKDPLLDENNRFPIGSTFKLMALREQDKARYTALRSLNQKAGLFYFFRSDCDYCHAQTPLLYSFAREFNFFIFMVSLDGKPLPGMKPDAYVVDQGQARQMGISVVPAIVLAVPPKDLFVITQGYLTYHAMQNRIYLAAEDLGLIPRELQVAAHPMERGVLSPEVLADAKALGLENDPAKMVDYLRRKTHEALYGEEVPGPLPLNLRAATAGFALAPETAIVPLAAPPSSHPAPLPGAPAAPPAPAPAVPPPGPVPPPALPEPEPESEAGGLTGLSFGDGLDE
ncbi:MAG: alpha/beta hydrolase, partial [Gammaproteobacteria bacterium]|nr:alpha/beta hydrolase [Gammaproteobacteria bacterium]